MHAVRLRGRRESWLVGPVLAVVLSIWRTWNTGLNGDLMYVLGGLRAAGDGGVPFGDIFIARPFAYKVWIAGLDAVRSVFVDDPSSLAGMRAIRLTASVAVLLVAVVLHRGLRRWVGELPAACAATAVAVGLIVSPRFNFLEPDWTAALTAVLAGGLLLCFGNEKLAWALGGVALWLTVAMKLSTAVFAAAAVLLVLLLSRRRAIGGALAGAVITIVWFVLSHLVQPLEWRWFADQAALVHDSPIHHAPRVADLVDLSEAVLNAALMSPVIVGGVAAAAVFVLRATNRRSRLTRLGVVALVMALAVASGFAQGEWFLYHFSDLAILAALVWGLAFGVGDRRQRVVLAAAPAFVGLVGAVVVPSFQGGDGPRYWTLVLVCLGTALIAVVALCWVERLPAPDTEGDTHAGVEDGVEDGVEAVTGTMSKGALVAVVAVVAFVAGMTTARPDVPLTIVGYNARKAPPASPQVTGAHLAKQQALGEQIGSSTPVLYLAYGSTVFAFPNPTPCPYPSPQWVQRASMSPVVQDLWSYRDNLRCITDRRAKYLVRGTGWFDTAKMPVGVQRLIAQQFDCSRQLRTTGTGLQICPRRQ